jgi:hypothetical protein
LLELITNRGETDLSLNSSSLVLIEVTLLQFSVVCLQVLLELFYHVNCFLGLIVNKRSDFLADIFGQLLQLSELLVQFLDLLNLGVLSDTVLLEHLERLFETIEFQDDLIVQVEY